jgi:hypothetical protein
MVIITDDDIIEPEYRYGKREHKDMFEVLRNQEISPEDLERRY